MSQETLRQMDPQWEERLNQSMRSMEQRFMEQLQEQKQIQRALEEKLHSMTQGNMGADDTPTPPRVNTKGSCSAVDPTQYSGQYELLVDGDPPRIVAIGRVLEGGQTIHGVAILPQHVRVTIDEVRDPQAQVPVPTPEINFVGEAIGSFIAWPRALIMSHIATPQVHGHNRCRPRTVFQGFYVMCWIKTIIRAVITDDWNERFKSTSPIPEDTIKQIRQEWTAYLLQRWSFKVNLVKEVKKERDGIRKDIKKCKRRSRNCRSATVYRLAALRSSRWMAFSHANIQPCSHVSDITLSRALFIYCAIRNLNVNIGQVIADEISVCANTSNNKAPLGHPSLITHLCKLAGVDTSVPPFERPRKAIDEAYYRQYCGGEDVAQPVPPRRARRERGPAQSQTSADTHEAEPFQMRDMYMSLIGAQLQSIHRGQRKEKEVTVVAWPEEPVHGGGAGAAEASVRDMEEDEAEEEDAFDDDEDEEEEEDTEDSSD
ncbi:hypothetical protein LR48_Vigan463s000400 [Vigna angularis]|uniref:Transposase Tnp1/En/Spm-like domain-containing protein n=1 Tax=Phaseolus angularis TaxID=3914 RepID=A0A0L9TB65_PHAAN|nr:hypothetical protein LR48_Vigan463s000400 [Vigna angularis]